MKWLSDFRNPQTGRVLLEQIRAIASRLDRRKPLRIMEVCGTHTMVAARWGLPRLLAPEVRLVSGPGCPVCVTVPGYLDAALDLARRGHVLVTFGDLMHVPASAGTLAEAQAEGADVRVCYAPDHALRVATELRQREVVFLAVGFETTVAPIVATLDRARRVGIRNLSFLTALKTIPPVLEILSRHPSLSVDGFLCPGHVSAIIGSHSYEHVCRVARIPCVIAGFEPLDILLGVWTILRQFDRGEVRLENVYMRAVRPEGNPRALRLIQQYLQPCAALWRGLGPLPSSGLEWRPQYRFWDAVHRFELSPTAGIEPPGCRCGEVIQGALEPEACPLFARQCSPETPVGPCMVSSEGSCAAAYRYGTDNAVAEKG